MRQRLDRLTRFAPIPAASRSVEAGMTDALDYDGDAWMQDIPRGWRVADAPLSPERASMIRQRVRDGAYLGAGYAGDIARRILASGAL